MIFNKLIAPLFARRGPPEEQQATAKKWLPVIDQDYCTGCSACVAVCPESSLEMVWSFATLTDPEACTSCGDCGEECPQDVMVMDWVPRASDGHRRGRWQEEAA